MMTIRPVILFLGLLIPALSLNGQDAREIVRKADEKARGNTAVAEMTIQIVRPTWQREMTMRSWSKGTELAMIKVISPARDAGIAYLKRGKEVWNWVPSIERTIKLPPSMMSQSWMGTDFTNDDLVKEASVLNDYTHALAGDTMVAGRSCHKIILTPKTSAAVVWGRLESFIDKKDFLMMLVRYYDEDGYLVNTLVAGDVRMLGGRLLPARVEMIPADKPGQKTVMLYKSLAFDRPIDDNFFTPQQMTRLP